MGITVLPEDLKIDVVQNVQLYDYRNQHNVFNSKIYLSKNTISFLRTGIKEVIGDDKTVQINNQSFVVMKSGNCLMTEKVSNSNKEYQSILLFFTNDDILSFLENNNLFLNKRQQKKSFYKFKYDQYINHFVESLERTLHLPKKIQRTLLKTKFEEIMLYLTAQHGASFLNELVQDVDDKVTRLKNIVENNKHHKLSLEELAFLCNMSISTFKRAFFKQYNQTPMKWFSDQRLNHVAVVLKTKSKRPIDLYMDAGYEDFTNFVQAFKNKFGVTPKQYQG